jgi:hypothetical protein
MPRERTFVLLLLTFVVGGLVLGHFRGQDRELVSFRLSPEHPAPEDRSRVERRWRDPQLEPVSTFGAGGESPVVQAVAARRGAAGEILVLDWADAAVKAFDESGSPAWRIPDPSAPGDGLRPVDFAVAAGGGLWVAESAAPRVALFDAGGTRRRVVTVGSPASRIVPAADGGFTILTLAAGSHLFETYGPDGELRRRFGRLLAGDFQEPLLLDGAVAADAAGGLVFAPTYVGVLAAYDRDGGLRFLVETVGGGSRDLPQVVATETRRFLDPGARLRSLAVHVAGGLVYVLSERRAASSRSRILDVYSISDGAYLHSLRLPTGPREFLVEGDRLYTVHKDRIETWRARAGFGG